MIAISLLFVRMLRCGASKSDGAALLPPKTGARALLAIEETNMSDKELRLLGYEPEILSFQSKPDLMAIRCKLIEGTPTGTRRTDKRVQLGLTTRDAMKLLLLLQNLRDDLKLRVEGKPTKTVIPPKGHH
jgi:hypothetical protein